MSRAGSELSGTVFWASISWAAAPAGRSPHHAPPLAPPAPALYSMLDRDQHLSSFDSLVEKYQARFGCCREETEKFNVWLAYLNLENQFGEDAEEAALKLFQRASQYTDPKKLHLAALSMFERSNRTTAAEQLVKAMTRKFGGSAKVPMLPPFKGARPFSCYQIRI